MFSEDNISEMMEPLITVVVPTYRRPDLLRKCLLALAQQQLERSLFRVVVVDDGNEAQTAQAVQGIVGQTGLPIQYLGQPVRRGPAAARNRGWQSAQTAYIAFTDDDCLPQPAWLTTGLLALQRGAQVITGRVKIPLPDQPTAHDRTTALLETAEFVTANLFCRRSALARVGGFDEAFDIAWREDSDLQFKLLEANISISTCPEAVIVHPIRSAPWYASLRDERKNRYDALLYKRHPVLFRQRIPAYRSLVMQYYAFVITFLAGLLALALGHTSVAIGVFAIWLLLTITIISRQLPDSPLKWENLRTAILTGVSKPFLSIYWRLYGAFRYKTWYW